MTVLSAVKPRRLTGGMAGVLGVLVPAIGVAIVPIWDFPGTTASASTLTAWIVSHRGPLQLMMIFYTLGVTLWVVFGAVVWTRLRSAAGPDSWIPTCFAGGLIGFTTLLLAGFTAFDILVYRRAAYGAATLLYDLTFGLLAMSGMPTAVALAAFAIGVYRWRFLPRATAHLAMLTAVAHVFLLLSFVAATGFFSLEGPVIAVIPALLWTWILNTGIALARTDARS